MNETVSIKNKTVSALLYSFVGFIAKSGIQFVIAIIMARLLMPKDYGIIGMVAVFIAISQLLIDSGMTQALIREKEVTQAEYSTVFYYNLLIAIIMYFLLFISANTISLFFREPLLIKIVRIVGLGVIINSFGLIQRTMLIRKLDFKTQTKIDVISSVGSGSMGIGFAYLGYGVWGLVVLSLANQVISAFLLSLWNRWLPSPSFSVAAFKRLFGFGWKMLCTGLLATLYANIYNVIIGRVYTASQLGYYEKSLQLRDVAANSITNSVTKVSYPVLSSVQDEHHRLKSGFEKIIKCSSFLTFPLMIGLAAIATPLIQLLFGDHWMPMVPYFQILCLSGMTFPHRSLNLTVLLVKGRSDLFLRLDILKVVIGMVMIATVIVLDYGIYGLLWTSFLLCKVAFFVNSYFSKKFISYSTAEQVKDMLPTLLISTVMGIIVYFCGDMLPSSNLIRLAGQITIGVITYIGLSKLLGIEELNTMLQLVGSIFNKIRTKNTVTMEKGSE